MIYILLLEEERSAHLAGKTQDAVPNLTYMYAKKNYHLL